MTDPWQRLKKASSEFWKSPDNDLSEFLTNLGGEIGVWMDYVPPGGADDDGLTMYMKLYKDSEVGVYLFRSESGAFIPPHFHDFPERVVFLTGYGTLLYNRDQKNKIEMTPEKSVLIPAGTLHEGRIDQGGKSVCVFYYTDLEIE